MNRKMLMIIAVIAIVAVIAIAAAAAGGNKSGTGGEDNNNDTGEMTAENSVMSATVSDVIVSGNITATGASETFLPLDAGEHFVVIKFNVTAKGSDGSAPALFWKLYTSDGQIRTLDFNAHSTYPDGLQAGATAAYVLVYAVADGAAPTKLVYDGLSDLEIALA